MIDQTNTPEYHLNNLRSCLEVVGQWPDEAALASQKRTDDEMRAEISSQMEQHSSKALLIEI